MIAEVASTGARGPLGFSSLQVAMAVRAQRLEPKSIPWRDRHGHEIGIALTGGLGSSSHGLARMVALAAPALAEAIAGITGELAVTDARPIPLVVCLPEPGRPDDEPAFEAVVAMIAERSGVAVDRERSAVVRRGQAGFAFAIEMAKLLLDAGAARVAVGGVDSYYHPGVLQWLDRGYRLHTLNAEDGFIPSEGASFLVLTRGGATRLAQIVDVATGTEAAALAGDDQPNNGDTMTALLAALQRRAGAPLEWAITDFNGERHRYNEWSKASLRALPRNISHSKWVWDLGDVGAASGAMYTTIAITLCRMGAAPSTRAVMALHSEGPDRGALLIDAGG
jgi:3-oxoacyl-[acyl-carrier-protein] synthase-1